MSIERRMMLTLRKMRKKKLFRKPRKKKNKDYTNNLTSFYLEDRCYKNTKNK